MARKDSQHSQYPSTGFSCQATDFNCSPFCADPAFLSLLFSYISDEMAVIDDKGRFVCVNEAAVEGLGYSRPYILHKTVVDFLNEKMSLHAWKTKYFDMLKRQGGPMSYRIERVSKGGEVKIIDVTAVFVAFKGKEFIFSFGRDVTRQVQLQRSLQDSKNLYRFLTEGAGDGIAAVDLKGRLTYANHRLQKLLGFTPAQYRGKSFLKFIFPSSHKKVMEIFESARQGEQRINENIEARTMTGEAIPFEINATPLVKSGKVFSIHVIARDMRSRRHAEQMARQTEKMDALRYFVAGTAQELRSPLLGASRRVQGLLDKYAGRDFEYVGYREFKDIFSNVEAIKEQVQHCYETAQRLMTMGQKKAGIQKDSCDIGQVIRDAVHEREDFMHQHGVRVRMLLATKGLRVRMSAVDLTQVLHNLVDNAVQAMPSGGQLTIKTSLAPRKGEVLMEVSDQGVGIPEDQLEHVFEPFFTTKSRGLRKNSGLGLSVVHSLVGASHGNLVVQSSLRKGTKVKVFLPIFRLKHKKK